MKNNARRIISVLICLTLILCSAFPAFAAKDNSRDNKANANVNVSVNVKVNGKGFKDVKEDHWAYKYIMWMLNRDIVHGIGDGTFLPNGTVTRAEFAKMMVRTLELEIYTPKEPTFDDVDKKDWEYPYVESSKKYLTYYKTSTGNYFRPSQPSVREDMAVALVKALGYQNEAVDESILNQFADASEITPSLRKYVALAVKYGLMKGYPENDKLYFGPMKNLTRAEAVTLLYRAYVVKEEKVPYEEDKLPYEEDEDNQDKDKEDKYIKPEVTLSLENGVQVLRWKKIDSKLLKEYRVVISKNDPTPDIEDGYLYKFTDPNRTFAIINNIDKYTGGDFGNYLTRGENYYITVIAVYKDKNVTGNVLQFQYTGMENPELYVAPVVTASEENGKLVLRWNQIDSPNFVGYRVVASKNDSTPSYPDNGYLYAISDRTKNYAVIDNSTAYNNGDFGGYFIKGEKYYFSVIAVYTDKVVGGNVIQCQYNGPDHPELFPAPVLTAAYEDGNLVLKWDKISSPELVEYRVVISEKNKAPAYPADGYYNAPYSPDTTSVIIDPSNVYTNGDFTTLTYGNEYYFSVTAVYKNNKYVAGNAVKVLYLVSK